MKKVVYSCESLPLGNYCSAWTLNLLLKDMDGTIRKQDGVTHYLRYMKKIYRKIAILSKLRLYSVYDCH